MSGNSSPSIAPLSNGQLAFAFRGSNGHLWFGQSGIHSGFDTGLGMWPSTSPSVAVMVDGSVAVAFQGAVSGDLWLYRNINGQGSAGDQGFGMQNNSSPNILPMPDAGFQIAFKANTGNLWIDLNGAGFDQGLGMN